MRERERESYEQLHYKTLIEIQERETDRQMEIYKISNHLVLGPTALMLSNYKSDIALIGML